MTTHPSRRSEHLRICPPKHPISSATTSALSWLPVSSLTPPRDPKEVTKSRSEPLVDAENQSTPQLPAPFTPTHSFLEHRTQIHPEGGLRLVPCLQQRPIPEPRLLPLQAIMIRRMKPRHRILPASWSLHCGPSPGPDRRHSFITIFLLRPPQSPFEGSSLIAGDPAQTPTHSISQQ